MTIKQLSLLYILYACAIYVYNKTTKENNLKKVLKKRPVPVKFNSDEKIRTHYTPKIANLFVFIIHRIERCYSDSVYQLNILLLKINFTINFISVFSKYVKSGTLVRETFKSSPYGNTMSVQGSTGSTVFLLLFHCYTKNYSNGYHGCILCYYILRLVIGFCL